LTLFQALKKFPIHERSCSSVKQEAGNCTCESAPSPLSVVVCLSLGELLQIAIYDDFVWLSNYTLLHGCETWTTWNVYG